MALLDNFAKTIQPLQQIKNKMSDIKICWHSFQFYKNACLLKIPFFSAKFFKKPMTPSFNHINPVPQCKDLIDLALSKTNRKTPTVIHPGYEIQRVRHFYIRKVKHAAEEFKSKLIGIVSEFPVIEDIHPFYSDLLSVLYDRDHYKMALGQVNATKSIIDKIMTEHVKLLKFGDTSHRCKQLKRAGLGKMATTVKKLSEPLRFLEEVRQHLSRLPSIDTSSRTIVICGYPNVGKSSFMNKVSRAHVDVQPYAFTTKSIYVGHFEYNDLTWQILDTPGILDHPLNERNTIEMLTITALAHLKSAVLFFIDLSETCGYTIEEQIALYATLTPLLTAKILIVFSKSDVISLADVKNASLLEFLEGKQYVEVSSEKSLNIEAARVAVCEMLLSERIALKQDKVTSYMHRIRPFVPETINEPVGTNYIGMNPMYGLPENETYFCNDKYDVIPEIYNGKNIADFIDSNIRERLVAVLSKNGNYSLEQHDVMTPEQRRAYEDCNNARIHANMMAHFRKRASVPEHRKNAVSTNQLATLNGDIILREPRVEKRSLVSAVPPPVRNKKVHAEKPGRYFDTKPRHLFRPKGSKHKK